MPRGRKNKSLDERIQDTQQSIYNLEVRTQELYEELEECGKRLMGYKDCFEIMGKDRNSYSKKDLEATFMRMKEDSYA